MKKMKNARVTVGKMVPGGLLAALVLTAPAGQPAVSAQQTSVQAIVPPVELPTLRQRTPVQSRITRGAPYSAETLTESVQVLADGNRIVRRTTTRVFRDAEGRVRTEQIAGSGEVERISISDPVEGASYTLNPKTKTAIKIGVVVARPSASAVLPSGAAPRAPTVGGVIGTRGGGGGGRGGSGGTGTGTGAGTGTASGGGGGGVGGRAGGRGGAAPAGTTTQEDLGQQVIEGVLATGTRRTTVIETGAIGNEQPIHIVSEEWFSPDLQVLVLTKHRDPRVGETTYRLSSIVRAEPARSLFEVPGDYKLEQPAIRRQQNRERVSES
jgi:hypothetical protein